VESYRLIGAFRGKSLWIRSALVRSWRSRRLVLVGGRAATRQAERKRGDMVRSKLLTTCYEILKECESSSELLKQVKGKVC